MTFVPFDWNEHRVIVLKALHEAGASYAVIASFCGCTKNTVKSKLNRLKRGVEPRPEKRRLAPRAAYREAMRTGTTGGLSMSDRLGAISKAS